MQTSQNKTTKQYISFASSIYSTSAKTRKLNTTSSTISHDPSSQSSLQPNNNKKKKYNHNKQKLQDVVIVPYKPYLISDYFTPKVKNKNKDNTLITTTIESTMTTSSTPSVN